MLALEMLAVSIDFTVVRAQSPVLPAIPQLAGAGFGMVIPRGIGNT